MESKSVRQIVVNSDGQTGWKCRIELGYPWPGCYFYCTTPPISLYLLLFDQRHYY